jgi:hypothetical protein
MNTTEARSCLIWGTTAEWTFSGRDGSLMKSSRAGGKYFITGSTVPGVAQLSNRERAFLTSFIVNQNRFGSVPEISTSTLKSILNGKRLTVVERADRLLTYLVNMSVDLGTKVLIAFNINGSANNLDTEIILAWSESVSYGEIEFLLNFLSEEGLVENLKQHTYAEKRHAVTPTVAGFSYVQNSITSVIYDQAFIAMWFDPTMRSVFDDGVVLGVKDSGYQPFRIDNKEHNNKIDDEIIAEIRRSKFLIADFTCGIDESSKSPVAIARGGVYYEAGFAQGLGIPVIWTCRADLISHVHFDTRQFNHILWSEPSELRVALRNRIVAVVRQGPN